MSPEVGEEARAPEVKLPSPQKVRGVLTKAGFGASHYDGWVWSAGFRVRSFGKAPAGRMLIDHMGRHFYGPMTDEQIEKERLSAAKMHLRYQAALVAAGIEVRLVERQKMGDGEHLEIGSPAQV